MHGSLFLLAWVQRTTETERDWEGESEQISMRHIRILSWAHKSHTVTVCRFNVLFSLFRSLPLLPPMWTLNYQHRRALPSQMHFNLNAFFRFSCQFHCLPFLSARYRVTNRLLSNKWENDTIKAMKTKKFFSLFVCLSVCMCSWNGEFIWIFQFWVSMVDLSDEDMIEKNRYLTGSYYSTNDFNMETVSGHRNTSWDQSNLWNCTMDWRSKHFCSNKWKQRKKNIRLEWIMRW